MWSTNCSNLLAIMNFLQISKPAGNWLEHLFEGTAREMLFVTYTVRRESNTTQFYRLSFIGYRFCGYRLSYIVYRLSFIGYRLSVIVYRLSVSGCRQWIRTSIHVFF